MQEMEDLFSGAAELLNRILFLPSAHSLVAVAGPPDAGKSLFAAQLVEVLNARLPGCAAAIPGDGFHYDNAVLTEWNLLDRKGAPETFDVGGLAALVRRLRTNDEAFVAVPVFDRELEIARAGGRIVPQSVRYLIIEGNYLLLRTEPWSDLAQYFDLECIIREDPSLLERRLLGRWASHGLTPEAARGKVQNNDLPNAKLVLAESRATDLVICARQMVNS